MDRRHLLATLGGAFAWPCFALGQPAGRLPEVGFLYPGASEAAVPRIAAFLDGLKSKGFVDGCNVTLVVRNRHAHAATKTIPIVAMDLEIDPVKDGLVQSIARPGGNLTGLFFDYPQFSAKWLELLSEAVPGLGCLAVLWDPATGTVQLDELTTQAKTRGLQLQVLKVNVPGELEPTIAAAADAKADGLLILSSPLFGTNPRPVADLALNIGCPRSHCFPSSRTWAG